MAKKRNKDREFTPTTKRLLAQRVAYTCSNPMCRRLTIKAHPTEEKVTLRGEAGHINSVGIDGPRYISTILDKDIKSFKNGIWLCEFCHGLVDDEHSTHTDTLLNKWKTETETYVQTLVVQDTRLRLLRILASETLGLLRIISAVPFVLDKTYTQPHGSNLDLTRIFMELELLLYDNEFWEEADIIKEINFDLENVTRFISDNQTKAHSNISKWKNTAVKRFMIEIMRYKIEAYDRYLNQENSMVNSVIARIKKKGDMVLEFDLKGTKLEKYK